MKAPEPFGAKLLRLREAAGLSMQQLGERAGISRQYVWRLEQGALQPSLETAQRLARALGKTLAVWE